MCQWQLPFVLIRLKQAKNGPMAIFFKILCICIAYNDEWSESENRTASYLNPTLILGPWLKCQYLLSCQGCLTWWRPALEAGRRRKTTRRTDVAHFTRIWPPAPILTHFRAHLESSHNPPSSGITSCPHQPPGITGSTLYLGNALMHASQ